MCIDMDVYVCSRTLVTFQVVETGIRNSFPIGQAAPTAHAHCLWSSGHSEDYDF